MMSKPNSLMLPATLLSLNPMTTTAGAPNTFGATAPSPSPAAEVSGLFPGGISPYGNVSQLHSPANGLQMNTSSDGDRASPYRPPAPAATPAPQPANGSASNLVQPAPAAPKGNLGPRAPSPMESPGPRRILSGTVGSNPEPVVQRGAGPGSKDEGKPIGSDKSADIRRTISLNSEDARRNYESPDQSVAGRTQGEDNNSNLGSHTSGAARRRHDGMKDKNHWYPRLQSEWARVSGIKATEGMRTRIYVTSASTMHSLINVLTHQELVTNTEFCDQVTADQFTDVNYMTHMVIRCYEKKKRVPDEDWQARPSSDLGSADRGRSACTDTPMTELATGQISQQPSIAEGDEVHTIFISIFTNSHQHLMPIVIMLSFFISIF
jgi:hypothetical protein